MDTYLDICIWDLDSERIANLDKKIRISLTKLKLQAHLHSNVEPPLVARMNLTARVPVLEINGVFWGQTPGKEFSQEACERLLSLAAQQYGHKDKEKRG